MHVYKDCVLVLLQNQLAEVKENSRKEENDGSVCYFQNQNIGVCG